MDRKSILVIVGCVLVLFLWGPIVNKIYPPIPIEVPVAPSASPSDPSSTNRTTDIISPDNRRVSVPSNAKEEIVEVETAEARYYFTSHGGGIKRIEIKKYPETVTCEKTNSGRLAQLNSMSPEAILAFRGSSDIDDDGVYRIRRSGDGVQMEKTLANGLHLIKEFRPGSNYLIKSSVRIQNNGREAVRFPPHDLVVGTASPLGPTHDPFFLGALWYDGSSLEQVTAAWFENKRFGCMKGNPRAFYQAGSNNVHWAAVNNQFFAVVVMPPTNAPAPQIISRPVSLVPDPAFTDTNLPPEQATGYLAALRYPELVFEGQQALQRDYTIYAGPKEYNLLARIASAEGNDVDRVMNFGKFIGFFSKILLLSMNGLHSLGLEYGWAIVVMTIIIKILFWPLTNASTKSMKRMAALQPQIQALQEKYKNEPEKKNRKMMEFMKENKVNPLGGCLPLLLQMPIFFGLFGMLRSAIELRGADFLWVCDLSQPDTVFRIPGIEFPINPMWFVMLVTMIFQMRLTPPSPGMDPMQQRIMKYMPVGFMALFYNFSAGLTLYWAVQNLLSILQTKITKAYDSGNPPPASPAVAKPVKPAPKKK